MSHDLSPGYRSYRGYRVSAGGHYRATIGPLSGQIVVQLLLGLSRHYRGTIGPFQPAC